MNLKEVKTQIHYLRTNKVNAQEFTDLATKIHSFLIKNYPEGTEERLLQEYRHLECEINNLIEGRLYWSCLYDKKIAKKVGNLSYSQWLEIE